MGRDDHVHPALLAAHAPGCRCPRGAGVLVPHAGGCAHRRRQGQGSSCQAEQLEAAANWAAAAEKYDELFKLDRTQLFARERYQHCLRRFFQIVRFRDGTYRNDVLSLKYPQTMRLYEIVLNNLLASALDRDQASPAARFGKGVEEFSLALASPEFCADHLGGFKPAQRKRCCAALQVHSASNKSMTSEDAAEAVRDAVMKSVSIFPNLNPTTVVMEFLCGACLALDEHTVYLTPRQLGELSRP